MSVAPFFVPLREGLILFIFSGAEKTNQKRHSPNQGLPPREGCKKKTAETPVFFRFGYRGTRDECLMLTHPAL